MIELVNELNEMKWKKMELTRVDVFVVELTARCMAEGKRNEWNGWLQLHWLYHGQLSGHSR